MLLRNQCADLALRARAAVRLGGEGSGVTSVAELGPLDGDLMLALARATPRVAGRWLAGRLEHNPVGDVRSALDALDDLPDDTKVGIAEAYAVNLHGEPDSAVLEWVAAVPGVLARTNQVPLVVLVARVAQQRLGDGLDAWQLFAELGAGSPSPVRDVLEVVIAAGDAAG